MCLASKYFVRFIIYIYYLGPYTRQYLAVAVPAYGVWLCFSSIAYYVNWIAWRFLKEENKANAFASDVEAWCLLNVAN